MAATKRFSTVARWFRALLRQDDQAFLPLRRVVHAERPDPASASGWAIQFDASTTGGGAILRHGTKIYEFFEIAWTAESAGHLGVEPGLPKFMPFWEFLTLVLALCVWGSQFVAHSVAVLGDNTAALTDALQLKGGGQLMAVARELAWRQARFGWSFAVGHVPSESNGVPDALSRTTEASGPAYPRLALRHAVEVKPPVLYGFWKVR